MAKDFIVEGSPEWEEICKQCGMCCLVKVNDMLGNVYLTNVRCSGLDKETHKCNCYTFDTTHRRDNGKMNCVCASREKLNNSYLVPSFCPYAQRFCKDKAIKTAPKEPLNIDWSKTISENELGEKKQIYGYIIPGSDKYFKYNPHVNMKMLNGR